ncbi:hypothetical protein NRIC_28090 [Enterococcus florum]|uniref:SAP domain-containing protein n=1 Tax=Enterococcus florum TaxID=2480627 RepID=A0A4P5PFA4_9ENTE|nr:DUF6434 domain-containing protein [Enterococcus florum]GCF94918.1 hypothetical protein NRIC_28090 [Enterococcus florum]
MRPILSKELPGKDFENYYYLKQELTDFCRQEGLQSSGSKEDLTKRISHFLTTGERRSRKDKPTFARSSAVVGIIKLTDTIEDNFICSERHRVFFRQHLGSRFTFNVPFQKWLKTNTGKTYQEAVEAYKRLAQTKKPREIGKQFEYNRYIRAFFADNRDRSLKEAITCWKNKKQQPGSNEYHPADLSALAKEQR